MYKLPIRTISTLIRHLLNINYALITVLAFIGNLFINFKCFEKKQVHKSSFSVYFCIKKSKLYNCYIYYFREI